MGAATVQESHHSPLIVAVHEGHIDVVQYLCQHGASAFVNEADITGRTPLFMAAIRGNEAMVHMMMTHGADVDKALVALAAKPEVCQFLKLCTLLF